MLRELHISNLAVIADARIEFDAGLNCFTGTTGAGKSLVIGALEVLLGLRSATDMLRSGADEGRVSGVFEIADPDVLKQLARVTDLPLENDGGELLLVRRIFASGRTSVSLNGNPITLAMLRQTAETLIDVHGQHDQQFLLRPAKQLRVLDEFARAQDLRREYEVAWVGLRDARARLEALAANRSLRQQQLDLYRFQAAEIDAAEIHPGEFDELQARSSILQNAQKLKRDTSATYAALYEADGAILERLKMMTAILAELADVDKSLRDVSGTVREATLQLEEAAFDLGRYLGRLDLDPAELAEVSERLTTLNRLMHKYGDPLDTVVKFREDLAGKIGALERETDDLSSTAEQIPPLEKTVNELAGHLSTKRQAAGERLAPLIDAELRELGMEKAAFSVSITPKESVDPSGGDDVEFIVRTNPGLPAQPLRKIASGGELSRVMLALKGVLAAAEDRVSVLVFDEIDSNVGGRLGAVIGQKLRTLARRHQILCITHLPQIAAYADRHLTVRKTADGDRTATTVRMMSGEDRVAEIAEMIGGQRVTETTIAQARELLETAFVAPKPQQPRPVTRSSKPPPLQVRRRARK